MLIKVIATITIILSLSAAGTFFSALQSANANIASLRSEKVDLTKQIETQKNVLKKFEHINKADMLTVCKNRANDDYLEYVRENSVTNDDGQVITHLPKFPGMLETASKELDSAKKSCDSTWG